MDASPSASSKAYPLRESWACAGSSATFPDKSASAYNKMHSGVKRVDVQACRVSLMNNKKRLAPGRLHQRLVHLWSFSVWIYFKRPINKWLHALRNGENGRLLQTSASTSCNLVHFPCSLLGERSNCSLDDPGTQDIFFGAIFWILFLHKAK